MFSKWFIKFIDALLLLTLFILLSFYVIVKNGLKVDSLELFGYKAQNLTIQLKDKFTLKVSTLSKNSENISKKVKIKTNKDSNSSTPPLLSNVVLVQKYLNRVLELSKFFEYISLESINFKNKNYLALFKENGFLYFGGEKFEFRGNLKKGKGKFLINYQKLYLKKYGLILDGNLSYSTINGDIDLSGRYNFADINGTYKVNIKAKNGLVTFKIDSKETKDLKKLLDLFRMNYITKEWLYNRIKAQKYKLIFLEGEAKIFKKQVKPIFSSLKAKAKLQNLSVKFHSKLPLIYAKNAFVYLKNKDLSFEFEEPKYENRSIDGSWVKLENIFNKRKLLLKLHIVYKGVMDKKLIHILNVYKIPISIRQEDGNSTGVLDMNIPLQKGKKLNYSSKIKLNGGYLIFKKNRYKIKKGEIFVTGKKIDLKDVEIILKNLNGVVNGNIDLKRKKGDFKVFLKSFFLPLGMGYLSIKNKKIKLKVYWSKKETIVKIPPLKTKIKIKKGGFIIDTQKLSLWKKYAHGFLRLFDGGDIKIIKSKNNTYKIAGDIYWEKCPLCIRKKSIKKWGIGIKITPKNLIFSSKKKSIYFNAKKKLLIIKNLNIDNTLLQEMLKSLKKLEKNKKILFVKNKTQKKNIKASSKEIELKVLGKNSSIFYPDFTLSCDKYILNLKGNLKKFKCFVGKYKVDVTLDKYGIKKIYTKNIDNKTLYKTFKINPIKNTKYKINIKRTGKDTFKGEIKIDGGVIEKLKNYNDLISFVNTIPSILTFSNPGFSDKGFEINKGEVTFILKKKILYLKSFILDGKSSTIAGDGKINIKTKSLDLNLVIKTAKKLGEKISQLPIIGYLLFGDDKSLTLGVKVEGTFSNPKIKTQPLTEALAYPLELLKRALQLPKKLQTPSKKKD